MAGADPSFSETHVVRTLFILDGGAVGRKRLVKLLGVGEGSVRTIIKRLAGEGLIESSMLGHFLTAKGKRRVASLRRKFSAPVSVQLDIVDGVKSLVVVYGLADKLKSGVVERDIAVKSGAAGAMIMCYSDGRLVFPSAEEELSVFKGALDLSNLNLSEGDAVVVSFAGSYAKAEDGAVAIALELCGN
jgi:hypothetical protein